MNVSEDKAKEILDFIVASKINPQATYKIEFWFSNYLMQIEWFMSGRMHVGYVRESGGKLCVFRTQSYRDALKTLLDVTCRTDIKCYYRNNNCVLIPHMTTLEQILIDIDMSKTLF